MTKGMRFFAATGLVMAAGLGVTASLSWRKPAEISFEPSTGWQASFPDERAVSTIASDAKQPYVIQAKFGKGRLVIIGMHHTKSPGDPELRVLEQHWQEAKPSVAIVEGKPSGVFAAINPVAKFGEPGLIVALARRASVPTFTWHVPEQQLIAELLKSYTAKQVAIFTVGSKYFSDLRFGKPDNSDAILSGLIKTRGQNPGIQGQIDSVQKFDTLWKQEFPGAKDWRDTSDEFGLPGYLEDVANTSRRIRDIHLLNISLRLVAKGETVFAVCGMNHATRLKPMIDEITANGSWAKVH